MAVWGHVLAFHLKLKSLSLILATDDIENNANDDNYRRQTNHECRVSFGTPHKSTVIEKYNSPVFLAELLLWYLSGNILGDEVLCGRRVDDVRMTCR